MYTINHTLHLELSLFKTLLLFLLLPANDLESIQEYRRQVDLVSHLIGTDADGGKLNKLISKHLSFFVMLL